MVLHRAAARRLPDVLHQHLRLRRAPAVCEHAYEATRRDLLARYDELAPIFAQHGITLRRDVLEEKRNLWQQVELDREKIKLAGKPAVWPSRRPAGWTTP